jgi:hypothetical protein
LLLLSRSSGEIAGERAAEIFGTPGAPSSGGLTRLEEFGRVLLSDVLCNNGDRFPLIWDNRGNLETSCF